EVNREHAVHMARPRTNLVWESKDDIRIALEDAISKTDGLTDGRLIPWSLQGCVQLPKYLESLPTEIHIDGKRIISGSDLIAIERNALVSSIVEQIAEWIFRR